mgnify:CR=1 FL=1
MDYKRSMEFQISLSPTEAAERLQAMTLEAFDPFSFLARFMYPGHIYCDIREAEHGVDFVFYSRENKSFLYYTAQDLYLRGTIRPEPEGSCVKVQFHYPQPYKIVMAACFVLLFLVVWVIEPKAEPIAVAAFLTLFVLIPFLVHRKRKAYQIQKLQSVFDGYIRAIEE